MHRALCFVLLTACGSSQQPPAEEPELAIRDETDEAEGASDAEDTPAELMEPSPDPAVTCLRVADRLGRCNATRAQAALDGLEPEDRDKAVAALADAAAGITRMRELCRSTLDEAETAYVQQMGKCLALDCTPLFDCVGRAQ